MQLGESSTHESDVAKMLQTAPQPTSGRLSNLAVARNGQRKQQLNVIPHFLGGMRHGVLKTAGDGHFGFKAVALWKMEKTT